MAARTEQASQPVKPSNPGEAIISFIGRLVLSLFVPIITFIVLWQGFLFLRNTNTPKLIQAVVAIIWGVGGVILLYVVANWLVERMGPKWVQRLQPFVFVGPAMAILVWYLALPTVRTFIASLQNADSSVFVGLQNYLTVFTDRAMLETFRNNLMWMVFGTTFTVALGLIVAVLADRSKYETLAKVAIFLPMAISFVGAGVIWSFIYALKPAGEPQIGVLNAIVTALGGQPQAFLAWTAIRPWNNLFLIVIVIWLQTGYAMVIFSAAIKGIPAELLEAARVDGANELQIFFQIMIPYIMGTIITVTTTVIIFTLKIFDVVIVMTGGQYGTDVIATQFYRQYSNYRNFGLGSAIAVILLLAVVPVMIYNLRQFREQEAF
ncbi:MAG TPA: sugar ABC transporter permease [Anaerolineales bacterium]